MLEFLLELPFGPPFRVAARPAGQAADQHSTCRHEQLRPLRAASDLIFKNTANTVRRSLCVSILAKFSKIILVIKVRRSLSATTKSS